MLKRIIGYLCLIIIILIFSFYLFIKFGVIPEYAQICDQVSGGVIEHCVNHKIVNVFFTLAGTFIENHSAAITAVATLFIGCFTGTLWWSTRMLWQSGEKQVVVARDAMIAGERAFVFPISFKYFYERAPKKRHWSFRFRPEWQNSGDTPTRRLITHVECELRASVLPTGFNFNYPTTKSGVGLIPPKITLMGGVAPQYPDPPITTQDILDVQAGRKYLYLRGWAKYFDVFPGTGIHITRFCWLISPVGNPTKFKPNSTVPHETLRFDYILHSEGNCADDECIE